MSERITQSSGSERWQRLAAWIAAVAAGSAWITGLVTNNAAQPWVFTIVGIALVAVFIVLAWQPVTTVFENVAEQRRDRRLQLRFGSTVLGLCRELKPLTDSSYALSVGTLLNRELPGGKRVVDARLYQAYSTILRQLHSAIEKCVSTAEANPVATLREFSSWLTDYLTVYEGMRAALAESLEACECDAGMLRAIKRDWTRVYERARELRATYVKLAHEVNGISRRARLQEYIEGPNEL